ncbi:alkaline phosphatase family protein [Clostridiales bacterium BAD-6]|uniref:Alkaline phosphatase family protein n=2 Tax=Sinanaerobacter chloroacetimidivorans TaxID=2818044 RepID=A0A8J7W4V8_9FIRM|nr:alkaline phosphatase family protein [Sinanaerobacter chloroacetimidivorans]
MNKLLIIVIDGCSPEYISKETTPNLYRIAKDGFCKGVKAAIPSVTNVNHATILSGRFPSEHGVVGNYYYNKDTGEQGFIESPDFIKADTILNIMHQKGASTALLTVKGKVLEVFGKGVDFRISMQDPNDIFARYLEMPPPPPVGSLEANGWILEACYKLLKKNNPDVVYCTTNDYMMHNYAPDTEEAIQQMKEIDSWIGKIYDLDHTREIYITADHGMSKKTHLINLQNIMDSKGYQVVCHPPIKDRYIENHIYQEGGVLFLYFKKEQDEKTEEILSFLEEAPYVDMVCSKEEAAKKFNLPIDLIGDYVVLAAEDYAFGEIEGEELVTENVRTHGSLYERAIPLIAVNAKEVPEKYRYSRDIVKIILED